MHLHWRQCRLLSNLDLIASSIETSGPLQHDSDKLLPRGLVDVESVDLILDALASINPDLVSVICRVHGHGVESDIIHAGNGFTISVNGPECLVLEVDSQVVGGDASCVFCVMLLYLRGADGFVRRSRGLPGFATLSLYMSTKKESVISGRTCSYHCERSGRW